MVIFLIRRCCIFAAIDLSGRLFVIELRERISYAELVNSVPRSSAARVSEHKYNEQLIDDSSQLAARRVNGGIGYTDGMDYIIWQ